MSVVAVNREQAKAIALLLLAHPGPARIEGGEGGKRYVNTVDRERFRIDLYGKTEEVVSP